VTRRLLAVVISAELNALDVLEEGVTNGHFDVVGELSVVDLEGRKFIFTRFHLGLSDFI
jgi:hypothetical protein